MEVVCANFMKEHKGHTASSYLLFGYIMFQKVAALTALEFPVNSQKTGTLKEI